MSSLKDINPKIKLLEAQTSYILEQSKDKRKKALAIIKEIIFESTETDVEAMSLYSEIMIEKAKYDKAFFYLNHCLKFEYRNARLW